MHNTYIQVVSIRAIMQMHTWIHSNMKKHKQASHNFCILRYVSHFLLFTDLQWCLLHCSPRGSGVWCPDTCTCHDHQQAVRVWFPVHHQWSSGTYNNVHVINVTVDIENLVVLPLGIYCVFLCMGYFSYICFYSYAFV